MSAQDPGTRQEQVIQYLSNTYSHHLMSAGIYALFRYFYIMRSTDNFLPRIKLNRPMWRYVTFSLSQSSIQ